MAEHSSRLSAAPTIARQRLRDAGRVSLGLFTRWDSLGVFLAVTVSYLLAYLYAITDIAVDMSAGFSYDMPVADPLARMFEPGPGQFSYEAIAFIELGVVTWVFSPLNTAIGLAVAVLVGVNLAVTYLAVTQPKACGLGASSGVFASLPALLAGGACCGPVIAIALGIQVGGVLLTVYSWLLPASVTLLLLSLVYVGGKVDPTAV